MRKNQNVNLITAKVNRDDEWYTLLSDVKDEMQHYSFSNMHVSCLCDGKNSAFWKYFNDNYEKLNLAGLSALNYDPAYRLERTADGLQLIQLVASGDFRGEDACELIDKCDVVVTNGPWSLFRDMIDILFKEKKKFLILGSLNAIGYKNVFPKIMTEQLWTGYTHPKEFIRPDGSLGKLGNAVWYTNLETQKIHNWIVTDCYYDKEKYPKYVNLDAINVDRISEIPMDYNGKMGVPLTYIEKHCPDQFEILGMDGSEYYDLLGQAPLGEEWLKAYRENGGTGNYTATMRSLALDAEHGCRTLYRRVIIKRKEK